MWSVSLAQPTGVVGWVMLRSRKNMDADFYSVREEGSRSGEHRDSERQLHSQPLSLLVLLLERVIHTV